MFINCALFFRSLWARGVHHTKSGLLGSDRLRACLDKNHCLPIYVDQSGKWTNFPLNSPNLYGLVSNQGQREEFRGGNRLYTGLTSLDSFLVWSLWVINEYTQLPYVKSSCDNCIQDQSGYSLDKHIGRIPKIIALAPGELFREIYNSLDSQVIGLGPLLHNVGIVHRPQSALSWSGYNPYKHII